MFDGQMPRATSPHPVWLVRHGETAWNIEGRSQGHRDSPLTDRGRAQADQVGALLARLTANTPGVRLVASHLGRAQATAAAIARHTGLAVETDPRLAEVSFGAWEGMTKPEIIAACPQIMGTAPALGWQFLAPGGESLAGVQARLADWLRTVTGPTIAVSHGMASRILRGLVTGLPLDDCLALAIPQDRVFRVEGEAVEEIAP
ncbi:histidine phosphatase family protein [Aerophototrophica crusticola]|uniref:Histidine phosphatase family protein n=1 Tax=Aerophototrophica crusticola TaxID=1709002 RepID=A0A858R9W8_9PROT|nr:histidine phosphatase family protein [Rhodospirillaceae bacterium B3]